MKLETNGDYNPIQLNETINLSPDGKVLSKSLMINLRGEDPKLVWREYQRLKNLIDGKENKPEKKEQNKKELEKDKNVCPECGGLLVEKQGISKKTGRPYHFVGCVNFKSGCSYTRPFVLEVDQNMPADRDLITVLD